MIEANIDALTIPTTVTETITSIREKPLCALASEIFSALFTVSLTKNERLGGYLRLDGLSKLNFEFLYDSIGGSDEFENMRIVNRGDLNYLPHEDLQIAFQYGHKYVLTSIEGDEFDGFTDFYGIEARYDIHKRVDLGVRGSVRHSWNSHIFDYSFGPSIGFNPMDNRWVSLGYNVTGFADEDFSRSNYTAQGPYVQFRFKFDQDTLKDVASLLQHDM